VPATKEVLSSLPNVFSALCLNSRGLDAFVQYRPFDRLFRVLFSPDYLPAMRRRRNSDPPGTLWCTALTWMYLVNWLCKYYSRNFCFSVYKNCIIFSCSVVRWHCCCVNVDVIVRHGGLCVLGDTASSLGSAVDELMRHQPSLRSEATKAIIKVCSLFSVFIARQQTDARYWYSNSVCPSVRNTLVLYEKGSTYRHSFFTVR